MLRLSFANLFSGFMFDPVPKITTPDLVIDDFPEFAFTIGLNTRWSDANHASEKDVEAKLRQLARRIVASHQTSDRIIGFEVHGHADKTLRPPAGSSAEQTEKEVSQDRAENAKEMLLRMIEEEGGRPIIAGIKANSRARGFGATHRIFAPALNEAQMKKNRRVEIFLKEFGVPFGPPPPPSPPPPPKPPEPGTSWKMRILSGTLTGVNVPIEGSPLQPGGAVIELDVEVIDVLRREKATFHLKGSALSVVGGPITSEKYETPGKFVPFQTMSGTVLSQLEGDVFIGKNGDAVSKKSTAGFLFIDFDLKATVTSPKVIELPSGQSRSNSLPDHSPGYLPAPVAGSSKMVGKVVPASDADLK